LAFQDGHPPLIILVTLPRPEPRLNNLAVCQVTDSVWADDIAPPTAAATYLHLSTFFIGITLHGSGEIFMIGSIKKLFASIFGIFVTILKLPITLITLPLKLLSSKKDKDPAQASAPAKQKKKSGAFFLEAEDAQGVPTPTPTPAAKAKAKNKVKVQAQPAPITATATALNLPQPTITTSNTPAPTPASNYTVFGSRRRPGANMKSYLDMAKAIKNA
jgi:hypothetical protein